MDGALPSRPDTSDTRVRRRDRAFMEAEWLDRLLATAALGQFALVWEDKPLIHTSLFWYDGTDIYWHTAAAGRLGVILEHGERHAAFTVAELGRILPAATPFAFSAEYASVVCYGVACCVRDGAEKRRAMEGIMAKYASHLVPGVDYAPMPDRDVAVPNVYRLVIAARIGKHNVKPPDQAGFTYPTDAFIAAERTAGRVTTRLGPHLTHPHHETGLETTKSRRERMMTNAHGMSRDAAIAFGHAWIRDWNERNLDAILAHYTEDVEFRSPRAAAMVGQPILYGKSALAAYWRAGLERLTALHFTLDHTIWDAERAELVIVYIAALNGQRTRACESFRFGPSGRVVAGEAMYGVALP